MSYEQTEQPRIVVKKQQNTHGHTSLGTTADHRSSSICLRPTGFSGREMYLGTSLRHPVVQFSIRWDLVVHFRYTDASQRPPGASCCCRMGWSDTVAVNGFKVNYRRVFAGDGASSIETGRRWCCFEMSHKSGLIFFYCGLVRADTPKPWHIKAELSARDTEAKKVFFL